MPSASSSHRTNPNMLRSRSDNTFCANGTQVDALLPSTGGVGGGGGGGGGKGATDGAQTLSCHHGHFDPYYYVILGSL